MEVIYVVPEYLNAMYSEMRYNLKGIAFLGDLGRDEEIMLSGS
jgi:hypothetical protein